MTLLVANWKMNLLSSEARALARELRQFHETAGKPAMWLAPSFPLLSPVVEECRGSKVQVGAQNVAFEREGAFTGETSVSQLKDIGCTFAIVGHSERRHQFHETIPECARRASFALKEQFPVIFCIGETLDERTQGKTLSVLESQLTPLVQFLTASPSSVSLLTLAYEPVWAIGTGKAASLDDIKEAHAFIVAWWQRTLPGSSVPCILYGGSVSPENFGAILKVPHVGGALVGKASLKASSFIQLAEIASH